MGPRVVTTSSSPLVLPGTEGSSSERPQAHLVVQQLSVEILRVQQPSLEVLRVQGSSPERPQAQLMVQQSPLEVLGTLGRGRLEE